MTHILEHRTMGEDRPVVEHNLGDIVQESGIFTTSPMGYTTHTMHLRIIIQGSDIEYKFSYRQDGESREAANRIEDIMKHPEGEILVAGSLERAADPSQDKPSQVQVYYLKHGGIEVEIDQWRKPRITDSKI